MLLITNMEMMSDYGTQKSETYFHKKTGLSMSLKGEKKKNYLREERLIASLTSCTQDIILYSSKNIGTVTLTQ